MIVGPPGGGKSTIYRTLAQTLTKLNPSEKINVDIMNPKVFDENSAYYGVYDPKTVEWKDGLFTHFYRKAYQSLHDQTPDIPGCVSLREFQV